MLGNGYNNSNSDNNKQEDKTSLFCPFWFSNPESKLDSSRLSWSYWKNLMKITISPKLDSQPGEKFAQYDGKNNISIHINHIKAQMLYHECMEMIANPNALNNVGVDSGAGGIICLSNGKEFGLNGLFLVVRKVDETGNVVSSFAYEFNISGYYKSIRNYNEQNKSFDTQPYNNIEIDTFLRALKDFADSSNYAYAYAVADALRTVEFKKLNGKTDDIMAKLGIQSKFTAPNGGANSRSFFKAPAAAEASGISTETARATTTLDDLANEME